MAFDMISSTNLANWIPTVWSKEVLADVENSLVTGALFDRSYEDLVRSGGDTIVVPHLAEISANIVNTAVDVTLYDAIQNVTNIALDFKYDIAIEVSDIEQLQTNPKYFSKVTSKLAYGIGKQIDVNCNVKFRDFNNQVGTVNTALTEDVLIDAYEKLNEANAPYSDRAWVFDPASITDLMKLDYFVRMDYVSGSVSEQGFVGRSILGSPVYISTNLDTYAGGPHAAGYFQRETVALVMQMQPKFEVARIPLRHADAIIGLAVWGIQEMRGTFGVTINTRS
ncbi:hypothetical protein LCGC14_2368420 [marine sediment metagenome]|uniref:Capsid protein n=1 Tax=marine sediment metagenome TaxID=412755 RepID=A0A0F9C4N1_9ZZZZ